MNNTPFTIAQMRPIRDGMTVSRPAHLGAVPVTWFSLGAGTTITPESYDCTTLYIAAEGAGCFVLGDDARPRRYAPVNCSFCRQKHCAVQRRTPA